MIKYFSSVIEKPVSTGGGKLIDDMQKIIETFLINEKKPFKEYSFGRMRNALFNMVLPTPYSENLLFGYLGNPFFSFPLVIGYIFIFCLIGVKKKIFKENFHIIIVDLIEWQSVLSKNNNESRLPKIFRCFLERLLISHIADSVISLVDKDFINEKYHPKKVNELELLDYKTSIRPNPMKDEEVIRILYTGDLGSRRGFDINFFEDILQNLNSSCELLIVARGMDENLQKKFEGFKNFRFLGPQEAEKLNLIARDCHFGLILYSPCYSYYNFAPSIKLSFYIANGLSVISTNLKRTAELNDKYHFGYSMEKEEMLQFLRNLSSSEIRRNETPRKQDYLADTFCIKL